MVTVVVHPMYILPVCTCKTLNTFYCNYLYTMILSENNNTDMWPTKCFTALKVLNCAPVDIVWLF